MYSLEFTVGGLPKTTNAKRGFSHWAQYHKEAVKWKRTLLPYLLAKKPPEPLDQARLTLTRGSSQEPDFDGLVSSFKHVIDALVECGVIANDKRENIDQPKYCWEKTDPKSGYIRVLVEAVGD